MWTRQFGMNPRRHHRTLRSSPDDDPSVAVEQKLALDRFTALYPDDHKAASAAFLAFAGVLGQVRRPSTVFLVSGSYFVLLCETQKALY